MLNRSFSASALTADMRILRIDQALEKCEAHLSLEEAVEAEVQSLLAQSLVILIYAEFEQKVRELIRERCRSVAATDDSVREFLDSCAESAFRGLKISEIAGLLRRFGESHKEAFNQRLEQNQRAKNMYDSIWINRHEIAHGEGSAVTVGDVKQYYEHGHCVLDYLRDALFQDESR